MPKRILIGVRVDKKLLDKLEEVVNKYGLSKSELVRYAILNLIRQWEKEYGVMEEEKK